MNSIDRIEAWLDVAQYANSHDADSPTPGSLSSASQASGKSDYSASSKKARAEKTAGLKAYRVNLGRTVESPVYFANIASLPKDILLPPNVVDIIKRLSESVFDTNFIPLSVKDRLQDISPLEEFPTHIFNIDTALDEQAATLSRHVRAIITEAGAAFDRSDDEAAWYSIVEKVLSFETDAKVPDDPFIPLPHPHFIVTNR
ncbi:hypothetical protein TWF506_010655 [Arthrobotrys conoides]|uniref:Uncharacterized protein n=1 Tax=Arthrobotrys conoides TaxID=74498 RepID=A0AAN8N961_9PEZI